LHPGTILLYFCKKVAIGFMSDLDVLVSGIEYKVRKLTGMLERSETERKELLNELSGLRDLAQEQRRQIQQLEEKINKIQMTQALTRNTDVASAKLRINELVREVDRCLALLNK
jgi:chromosome segregation ATPase